MKLSDIMSAMRLSTYAEIALVIFFAVFVGVVLHVYRKGGRREYERARFMPLEDDAESEKLARKERGRSPREERSDEEGRRDGAPIYEEP